MAVSKTGALVRIILYYDDPKKQGGSTDFNFDKISRAAMAYEDARNILIAHQRKERNSQEALAFAARKRSVKLQRDFTGEDLAAREGKPLADWHPGEE